MAHVFAKQSGNWTDTTLWAFWNESTQQIEDYGQVPQDGDTVYLNSYTITSDINIGNGLITNKVNPHTTLNLGKLVDNTTTTINITANFEGYLYNSVILDSTPSNRKNITINGNITTCTISSKYGNLIVNGNVTDSVISMSTTSHNYGTTLTINGNIETSLGVTPFPITGSGTNSTSSFTVNGNITDNGSAEFCSRINKLSIVINGDYISTNTHPLCNAQVISFELNGIYSSIFSNWVITNLFYVGENTQFILTDRNNRQFSFSTSGVLITDYPAESNVKKDVPYAFGQMVGTYQPDFPQESVVLKDVTYDNGNKTGTLETTNLSQTVLDRLSNCVTIDTLNSIINAKL